MKNKKCSLYTKFVNYLDKLKAGLEPNCFAFVGNCANKASQITHELEIGRLLLIGMKDQ